MDDAVTKGTEILTGMYLRSVVWMFCNARTQRPGLNVSSRGRLTRWWWQRSRVDG